MLRGERVGEGKGSGVLSGLVEPPYTPHQVTPRQENNGVCSFFWPPSCTEAELGGLLATAGWRVPRVPGTVS